MKKLMATLWVILPFTVFGQTEFSLFAGPQVTTAVYKANDIKQETGSKIGFIAGAGWKIPFENRLYFAPEVFYSLKGYKVTYTQFLFPPGPDAKDNDTRIHTFELAGLLQVDLSDQPAHFFLKGGLSLDFQLFGKEKFNTGPGMTVNRNMKFDFGEYGHYSANAIFQVGYETPTGFFIAGRYSYGLASINNADQGPNIHHIAYGLGIGFYFKRNKIVIDTRNRE